MKIAQRVSAKLGSVFGGSCVFLLLFLAAGCSQKFVEEPLVFIQIQDRNGLTETINHPERLSGYESTDFFASQPYQKVLRMYKTEGKNRSKITTYHPNGIIYQYLEAEEMRAHGAYQEWFANGQKRIDAKVIAGTADLSEGTQKDWIFDEESKVWDEQGNLIAHIPYEKGVLQGKSLYYYPSGVLEKEMLFEKNKPHGLSVEYWPSGSPKEKTDYVKGQKEGESLGFFENGALAWIEEYEADRLKKGSYYNPEGDLLSEIDKGGGFKVRYEEDGVLFIEHKVGLVSGEVRKTTWDGELLRTLFLKNGVKEGEEIEYFLSSDLEENSTLPLPKLSVHWHEHKIHGCVKTWYNNGNLQSQREYCRNQKMGPSLAWYRNGALMLYEEYENGHLVMGQYYSIHQKEPISSVLDGTGIATLFDEKGGLVRKVQYVKGVPVEPED